MKFVIIFHLLFFPTRTQNGLDDDFFSADEVRLCWAMKQASKKEENRYTNTPRRMRPNEIFYLFSMHTFTSSHQRQRHCFTDRDRMMGSCEENETARERCWSSQSESSNIG